MTGNRWVESDRWLVAIPILVAFAAYAAACCGGFVYDDHHSVSENGALRSLANVPAFFMDVDMFSSLDNRMYRPVLLCTFALNYAIAGLEPWFYKLTNLCLHGASAGLLFAIARRLGVARSGALLGGVLFAAHPMASEAVNMISGRSELLVVCALLGGMRFHLAAVDGCRWSSFGTVACAVVACGAKETGVILPVLLFALEFVTRRDRVVRWSATVARLMPVVAVIVLYLLVRRELLGVATLRAPEWSGAGDPRTGAGRDMVTQLCTMAVVLPQTLGQIFVPVGFSLDPAIEYRSDFRSLPVVVGALFLAGLTFAGLRRPSKGPGLAIGTAFAWGTALPWVLIPLNVPLSEHRLYGLLAGVSMVIGAACPLQFRAPSLRWVAAAAAGVLACVSTMRSLDYSDEKNLWHRALASNTESYRSCYGLGVCLMKDGDLDGARHWMERAIEVYPDYLSARKNLIEIHLQQGDGGDPGVALALAEDLVGRVPNNPFYLLLLSRSATAVAVGSGDEECFDRAVEAALKCLDIAPAKGLVYRTAAHARRQQGWNEAALELLDRSVAAGLDHVSVLLDRYEVLVALGRAEEAQAQLRVATARDPFDPRVMRAMSAGANVARPPSPR